MTTPDWVHTLAYWLHMLATVIWFGGLSALNLLIIPAARQTLNTGDYALLLGKIQKRLDPVGWFSLVILIATGMVQLSANSNYRGILAVDDRWAAAILVKHILFIAVILFSAYMTWILLPSLRRLAIKQAHIGTDSEITREAMENREVLIMRINLLLGVLILLLTAVARTS